MWRFDTFEAARSMAMSTPKRAHVVTLADGSFIVVMSRWTDGTVLVLGQDENVLARLEATERGAIVHSVEASMPGAGELRDWWKDSDLDVDAESAYDGDEEDERGPKSRKMVKYACPTCGDELWAKPGLHVECYGVTEFHEPEAFVVKRTS